MTTMRKKTPRERKRKVSPAARKAFAPYRWNPRVACRTLDGTAFILLNSRMVRLNEVGTHIWERCEHGATLDEIVESVVNEFSTTESRARKDAQAFVAELVGKEMLVSATAKSESGRSL